MRFSATTGEYYTWFRGSDAFLDQAERQIAVAADTPIRWIFAETKAAAATQRAFDEAGITMIEIVVVPET